MNIVEGSGRFQKVLEGSRRFQKVLEGSSTYKDDCNSSLQNILEHSRRFQKVLEGSSTYEDDCNSSLFIEQCIMFQIYLEYSLEGCSSPPPIGQSEPSQTSTEFSMQACQNVRKKFLEYSKEDSRVIRQSSLVGTLFPIASSYWSVGAALLLLVSRSFPLKLYFSYQGKVYIFAPCCVPLSELSPRPRRLSTRLHQRRSEALHRRKGILASRRF